MIRDAEALLAQPERFQDLFTRLIATEAMAPPLADLRTKSWVERATVPSFTNTGGAAGAQC